MKITGLGLLNDVCPQALGFTKVTLIHAENARGKSTLSALFRSVNSGEVTELQERRTIGGTDDPSATLRFDTSVDVVLDKGSWSAVRGEIAVFDAGTVALGDRRACGIVGGGGTIQIASWSSSNAVASRNTGAVSTPSS